MQKILASIVAILIAAAVPALHKSFNIYMMAFFRDISRVKARKRRMKSDAVISMKDIKAIIFNEDDDPLKDIVAQIMMSGHDSLNHDNEGDLPIYSREELYEYGNGDGGTSNEVILLSIFGRVYDVSAGAKHYGSDGKYHLFAGRDVTLSLSTGCLQETCLGSKESGDQLETFELNDKTMKEGKKWVAFFETHDVYNHIGFLKDGQSIEHLIDSLVEKETSSLSKDDAVAS